MCINGDNTIRNDTNNEIPPNNILLLEILYIPKTNVTKNIMMTTKITISCMIYYII